ncbi:hypothetical protein KAFR_0C06050 [Kazachstania africana CBS 2517]|uniref:Growth regulation protein n=1 Tax=Kazachstania africana (strain ATCC 22294 / BCRC 22015 / CBS 2517 / CECT 1963 / NBRC 1671 / NRRL Y-8276) TaxID=1071382 RepID=H2AT96_KAZAF|nr:hypothetical protein KAFR_0C06050 [Kazachstania africana CBS 2517]CCF57596.1 hypothetical protein KAFR_0C06050 [Kazachstania africana CBS 2517]
MQNIITQVSQEGANGNPLLGNSQQQFYNSADSSDYYDGSENDMYGNSLIHLNIQENHYFITRDQLMSLPESLLLCLFPSGVFLDRDGQVITNLTPEDEVYIVTFPPDCFEYIMEIFTKAHDDLVNHPIEEFFGKPSSSGFVNSAKGFFNFGYSNQNNQSTSEQDLLHQKPAIIVLREDLDYYCVPLHEFQFEMNENETDSINHENNEDLLQHFMAQVKIAAGSFLANNTSIFQGLFSTNRLRYQNNTNNNNNNNTISTNNMDSKQLGPAEQHLMDMLCSSGFTIESKWGNRTQEAGKTVISSLSLCRLANETTQQFREKYELARLKWLQEYTEKINSTSNNTRPSLLLSRSSLSITDAYNNNTLSESSLSLTPSRSNNLTPSKSALGISNGREGRNEKRKSRLSVLADNVRSRSTSKNRHGSKNENIELPKVYDLVEKPNINAKLLLFWRKPARKCWWGDEEIELEVEIYGEWVDKDKKIVKLKLPQNFTESQDNEEILLKSLNKIKIPVRLHIRRVWTLELSVIGVQ